MTKRRGFKIRDVALLLMLAVVLPLSGIASFSIYILHRNEVYRNIDSELETAATFAHQTLGKEYHDGIHDGSSISEEQFNQIVARHNELCKELELEYIWSLLVLNGEIVFTSSTSPDKMVENEKHAKFLEPHSNPELYTVVFQTMETQYKDNSDKWGDIRAVLIPHHDVHGRKYLVGASRKLTELEALTPFLIRSTALVTLIFLIPGIALSIYTANRFSKPLRQLAKSAQEMGKGNYDVELQKSGVSELNILAQELNSMKGSFLGTLHELEKFLNVVSQSPIMIYQVKANEEMTTEFISDNYAQMGYDLEDLRNNTIKWVDLIPKEDLERVDQIVAESLAAGSDNHVSEVRMKWADGNYHWYQCWNQFVRDEQGEIASVQGIMAEITELKETQKRDAIQQEKLRDSLHQLQAFETIVTNSPVFTFQRKLDQQFTTIHISENIRITGYEAEDFLNGRVEWKELIPPEDYENLERVALASLERGENQYTVEFRMVWKNGEIHSYISWNNILRDPEGNPSHVQGLVSDITDLKAAQKRDELYQRELESSLREIEELRQTVSASPVLVYKALANDEGTPVFLSENYTDLGYDLSDFYTGKIKWADLLSEEDLALSAHLMEDAISSGRNTFSCELNIKKGSGEIRSFQSWHQIVRDVEGNHQYTRGILTDITEVKKLQTELMENRSQLQDSITQLNHIELLITKSPVFAFQVIANDDFTPIWLTDNLGITGYYADQFLSGELNWNDLFHPDDYDRVIATIRNNIESNVDNYTLEFRMVWKNGEARWYHAWHTIIRDEAGKPSMIQGLVLEITDVKEAYERDLQYQQKLRALTQDLLKVEDKERRRLAIALHDDIGQMLAALNMKLAVLKETDDHGLINSLIPQVDELLSKIMVTTKTLTWEISPTSLYETDISAGLERMAEEIENLFGLHTEILDAGARIVLDRNTAAIIFRCTKELLVNVAKHSKVGTAEIGISNYGNKVHLVVSDDGSGFDPDELQKDTRKGGYGLFSISERIDHLGGSMRIESAPNEGTKIMIIMPVDIKETLGE